MINLKSKKISIILFPALILILLFTIILGSNKTNFFFKASSGDLPKDIRITNITDDSITVSYLTNGAVIGTVLFGTVENNLDTLSLDDRDQLNQTAKKYNTHLITLRGLEANTNYFFVINSGEKNYLNNNRPFTIKTGTIITSNPPSQIPAAGDVSFQNNSSPSDGIVYLNINGAQEVSALIKNGNYIIPLNSLRNKELNKYYLLPSNTNIDIEAFANEQGGRIVTNASSLSPVKTINLEENFNNETSEFSPTIDTANIDPIPTVQVRKKDSIIDSFNIFKFFHSAQ